MADVLADFFNKVSREFDALEPHQILITKDRKLPVFQCGEVAARLKRFRKPKSMVPGDIFPKLVTDYADFFAIPLTSIYNSITTLSVWPVCWKREFVTVIPKKQPPGPRRP